MNNYRNTQQIMADVLVVISDSDRSGIGVTKLCSKSNLSHGRLKKLVNRLTSSGLTNTIEYDGKNTFVLTEKGKLYLDEYKRFSDFAESFGVEM